MGIEKMGSTLEQRARRNGRAIDMQWLRENEANEMYRPSNKSDGYDTSYSQRDSEADRRDVKEILEIIEKMMQEEKENADMLGSSSNLEEQSVILNERKKLEIYTEQDTEAERQKRFAIPRQYVVLNGDKYYFSQEYIATPKTSEELEADRISQELAAAAGIEVPESSTFKNSHYANTGLLPNGNMILKDPTGMMGMVDSYGDILIDFKYHSIKPITNRNNEIVHDNCFIAESNNSHFSEKINNVVYSTGIIESNGTELYPIDESDVEAIRYDDENDILHCCNYNDWVGLVYSKTGFEKDIKTIYGYELESGYDRYSDLEDKIFG